MLDASRHSNSPKQTSTTTKRQKSTGYKWPSPPFRGNLKHREDYPFSPIQEADLEEKHVHGDNCLKSDQPAVGFLQNKSCFWMGRWTQSNKNHESGYTGMKCRIRYALFIYVSLLCEAHVDISLWSGV